MNPPKGFLDFLIITLGSFLLAVSLQVFFIPNNFLTGGISGLALITHHLTPLPLGPLIVLYNIPILLWARKELNNKFIIYTITAIILQSLFLYFVRDFTPYTKDTLLASILGGALGGAGVGLIIRYHGSLGGIDIISILLKKQLGISIGTINFTANLIITCVAAFIFGMEPAMYTLVSLFTMGKTLDTVQQGFNKKRTTMIISDKSLELKDAIISQLNRGVTLIHGAGGFKNVEKDMIFCVVNQFELARLKEIVNMIDKNAFMTISETSEVLGAFREQRLNLIKESFWKTPRTTKTS